jgi:hypothetical protein
MSAFVVWVSQSGLIIKVNEEGYSLEDPLEVEPIQWCDSIAELQRIVEDIELNPFKVGDKVRVKHVEHDGFYKDGEFDTVYFIANNGAMCIQYFGCNDISACVYKWRGLQPYSA